MNIAAPVAVERYSEMGPTEPGLTAQQIRSARFEPARRGYDPLEVDAFLSELADRIDAGETITPIDIAGARFQLAKRGYDTSQVDGLLQRLLE